MSATAEGLGFGRTAPGRGAWLCSEPCLEAALRKGRLDRALRRTLSNPDRDLVRARLFG